MLHKIFNFSLIAVFLGLVFLFAYKENTAPEIVKAPINTSSSNVESSPAKPSITREEVREIVKDYILKNPEIIINSLEELHNKKVAASNQKMSEFLENNKEEIEQVDSPPYIGNKDGDIVIVSFFDYNCSFCKKSNIEDNNLIAADPGVKIVMRPLPILGEGSVYAAKIALVVNRIAPDKFKDFHTDLMKIRNINEMAVKELLGKYQLDLKIVENEVNSYSIKQTIDKNLKLAGEAGIKGTPSYIINGKFIPGLIPLDNLKNIIMQLRSK